MILDHFAKPSMGVLIKLGLVQPWLARQGRALSSSFFLIREQFTQKIGEKSMKEKKIGYAALSILCYLTQAKTSLTDQGI